SQLAGRFHGMEESCLGSTQPEKPRSEKASSSKATRVLREEGMSGSELRIIGPVCNCRFGRKGRANPLDEPRLVGTTRPTCDGLEAEEFLGGHRPPLLFTPARRRWMRARVCGRSFLRVRRDLRRDAPGP